MRVIAYCLCLATAARPILPAPADGFVFPDEVRKEKKLEPIITPPVLPYIEHLERDPSTLLPNERSNTRPLGQGRVKPRFGFGGGFDVGPSGNGGLTASVSQSSSGFGNSQAASQSFSVGFNEGFSASHSASQSASFNGFGSGFSGSQASSQAGSFNAGAVSGAASSSSAFAAGSASQSQSASSAFGFNSVNGFIPNDPVFEEGLLDIRHRGVPNFPFPTFPSFVGRSKGVGAAAFRGKSRPSPRNKDDFLAVLVSS